MPDLLKTASGRALALGALAALTLWWLTSRGNAQRAAGAIVETVAGLAVDTASGAVIGLGRAVGIPETSADQCTLDLAAGRYGAASFSCPAPRYLAAAFGRSDFEVEKQKFIQAERAD